MSNHPQKPTDDRYVWVLTTEFHHEDDDGPFWECFIGGVFSSQDRAIRFHATQISEPSGRAWSGNGTRITMAGREDGSGDGSQHVIERYIAERRPHHSHSKDSADG